MNNKLTAQDCIELLRERAGTLGHLPTRADLAPEQTAAVKAHFGPWPRALEAAGLKPPRSKEALLKRQEKRIRSKVKKTQVKIQKIKSGEVKK
jgi:hypothetical protein